MSGHNYETGARKQRISNRAQNDAIVDEESTCHFSTTRRNQEKSLSSNLSLQQLDNLGSGTLTNQWSPQVRVSGQLGNSQSTSKQEKVQTQTAEAQLSSFESDYDLLLYLGETETEDLVDTERSLDYQDQTWRQSICGGASLAPTIDGSFSELLGISSPSNNNNNNQDFDLLNTPTTPQTLRVSPTLSGSRNFPETDKRKYRNLRSSPADPFLRVYGNSTDPQNRIISNESEPEAECETSTTLQTTETLAGRINNIRKEGNSLTNLPDNSWANCNKPPYNQSTLPSELEKSRTLDNRQPRRADIERAKTMSRIAQPADRIDESDELDRLLAEMSESLDMKALARFDTRAMQPPAITNHSSVKTRNSNSKQVQASSESLLDEYDGASRLLEQMIAEQLENRPTNDLGSLRHRQQAPPMSQHQQVNKQQLFSSSPQQPNYTPDHHVSENLSSTNRGQVIITKPARPSIAASPNSSYQSSQQVVDNLHQDGDDDDDDVDEDEEQPPKPPVPDYFTDSELANSGIIRLEAEEFPKNLEISMRKGSIASREPESQINRMKRRTLSSMRSVRHKISDLVSPTGYRSGKKKEEVESRASSISPTRLAAAAVEPEKEPNRVQERESRSFSRRAINSNKKDIATGKGESFGEQIMRRLSRSKSRVSKWLLRGSRWEKRAQSTPNIKSSSSPQVPLREASQTKVDADAERDNILFQFQPGDIARNSKLPEPNSSVTAAGTQDSFNQSLDRHLAREMAAIKRCNSGSEVSSHLSGIECGPEASRGTRPARSRSRRLTREEKATEDRKARTASLLSLKRLSTNDSTPPAQESGPIGALLSGGTSTSGNSRSRAAKRAARRRKQGESATQSSSPHRITCHSTLSHASSTTSDSSAGSLSPQKVEYFGGHERQLRRRRAGSRRPKSCDPKSWAPNRSSSLRSIRSTSQHQQVSSGQPELPTRSAGKPERSPRKRTVSFSNLSSNSNHHPIERPCRGTTTTSTFRPASSLAVQARTTPTQLNRATEASSPTYRVREEPGACVTPVGLSVSPPALQQRAKSARPDWAEPDAEPSRLRPIRAKSTALLADLKHKCTELWSGSKGPPVPPPRRQRGSTRSKSIGPVRELEDQKNRLSSLVATHLKHSDADFSPSSPSLCKVNSQQQVNSNQIGKKEKELLWCEWKPVIEVPPSRVLSFSRKFRPQQQQQQQQQQQDKEKHWTHSTGEQSDRKQNSSSIQSPLKAQAADRKWQEQQAGIGIAAIRRKQSIVPDTDSTWESSSCDDFKQDNSLVQAPKDDVRQVQTTNESSSGFVLIGKTNMSESQDHQLMSGSWKQQGGQVEPLVADNNNNSSKDQAQLVAAAAAAAAKGDIPSSASHSFSYSYPFNIEQQVSSPDSAREKLDRSMGIPFPMKISSVLSKQASSSSIPSASVVAAEAAMQVDVDPACGISSLQAENRGVATSATSSKNSKEKENEFIEFEVESKKQENFSAAAAANSLKSHANQSAQKVCQRQFTFSSDLPDPAESLNWSQHDKQVSSNEKKVHSRFRDKAPPTPLVAGTLISNESRQQDPKSSKMALSQRRIPEGCEVSLESETGEKLLIDNDDTQVEEEQEKRLSRYENVINEKNWSELSRNLPAWPPVSQVGENVRENSAQNSSWSIDDELERENNNASSMYQLEQKQIKKDLSNNKKYEKAAKTPTPTNRTGAHHAERKLVHMLSIIQDPNDELMVTSTSSHSQERPATSQVTRSKADLNRQDSAPSLAASLSASDYGNNSDSESSLMQQVGSNKQRLIAKLQPQVVARKVSVPSSQSTALGSSSSRVKRLAQTFESAVAAASARPSTQQVAAAKALPEQPALTGVEEDLPSEASTGSDWYDTNEQLDQSELAKFLEEFDNDDTNNSRLDSVSTGADPFVTLADSTLDDRALAPTGQVKRGTKITELNDENEDGEDDDDDDDNTLNDAASSAADDDLLSEYCVPPEDPTEEQGKEMHDCERQHVRSQVLDVRCAEDAGCCEGVRRRAVRVSRVDEGEDDDDEDDEDANEREVASGIVGFCGEDGDLAGSEEQAATSVCTTTSSDLSTVVSAEEQRQPVVSTVTEVDSLVSGVAYAFVAPDTPDSESDNNNIFIAGRDLQGGQKITTINSSSSNNNNNNNHTGDICCATKKTTTLASASASPSSPKSVKRTVDTTVTSPLTKQQQQLDYNNKTLTSHAQPLNHRQLINHTQQRRNSQVHLQSSEEDQSPGNSWSQERNSRGKLDETFKQSLNLIIGNQHQHTQPQMVVGAASQQQTLTAKNTHHQNQSNEVQKELKGLARYYRAILRRRKGGNSNKSDKGNNSSSTKIAKKAEIRDYIHSSSSSDADSSDSDDSSTEFRGVNTGKADQQSKQHLSCREKLARNAKKCSRIYEELERILARKVEAPSTSINKRQQLKQLSNESNLDEEDDEEEEEEEEDEEEEEEGELDDEYYYEGSISSAAAINGTAEDQLSLSSSSVSCDSLPEIRHRQNLQKLYNIVKEIHSSEAKFVDTLKLMNVELRAHMEPITSSSSLAYQAESLGNLLKHLPQLQALNESLLEELRLAMIEWPKSRKIAHVLVKIGPFLKHYSTYIRDFDSLQQQLAEAQRKYPQFAERIRQFEARERCQRLSIQHHLLKPIQRIPQYRLLLQQYLHYLKPDDIDYEDTVNALEVVSRVAEHANEAMNEGANFAKLLALQAKIVGKQRDIVQPGRLFIREGELMKVCRKQVQPRWFVLLSDALLYLTQIQSSDILYLNNELPLDDCQVSTPSEQQANLIGQQFDTEFTVCTRARSFALVAKTREERDQWVTAFRQTIDEHLARKRSFSVRSSGKPDSSAGHNNSLSRPTSAISLPVGSSPSQVTRSNSLSMDNHHQQQQLLGMKAPLWTPDSRVSMCQLCTSSFSPLFRRHHCRACGKVVCSACSSNRAPLMYLKCRAARTCDPCFQLLRANIHLYYLASNSPTGRLSQGEPELKRLDEHFKTLLKSQFVQHGEWRGLAKIARSASSSSSKSAQRQHLLSPAQPSPPPTCSSDQKQQQQLEPSTITDQQTASNDSGSLISGYLHRRHAQKAKWKRQWFVISREKVLFAYRAIDDVAHVSSLPLLGYQADQPAEPVDGLEPTTLLRLTHQSSYSTSTSAKQPKPIIHLFKAESIGAAQRWLDALKRSVVLDDNEMATG